ncbi:MAG: tRNA threonylcarbamoyladenosine dehydratase [Lachnospiraceae bacterium]|nr:tRNA threonylcarbamoyladenosine dehydratase [Lachnospiraceae bacterium]
MNEFSRTERLIGTDNMHKLSDSTVAVFGVGGVGSHCIEALARCGTGHLILIDNDVVSETNINRQSIAWHSTVGQHKTRVMKTRILDINPAARIDLFETFVLPENLENLLNAMGAVDYMVDAIDTVSAKIALAQYAQIHQIPLIASMGTGNKLHGELFEIADIYETSVCPLCRVMRKELKTRGVHHLKVLYSREQPLTPVLPSEETTSRRSVPGSVSFVPPVAGLLIAGEVIRELLKLP